MAKPTVKPSKSSSAKGSGAAKAVPPPLPPGEKGYARTLSLRLTDEQYRRLRRYVTSQEEATGRRITHQFIIEAALAQYLDSKKA